MEKKNIYFAPAVELVPSESDELLCYSGGATTEPYDPDTDTYQW